MSVNINSAYRAHAVLSKAAGRPDAETALEVWKNVFEITDSDQSTSFIIVDALGNLRDEIANVGIQMAASSYSESLYKQHITKATNTTRIDNLSTKWNTYKGNLSPDTLLCFRFCLEILPNEESLMEEEDVKSLVEELERLERYATETELPHDLKKFLERQIRLIKTAIVNYKVVGAKSLRSAFTNGFGEIVEEESVIVDNSSDEGLTLLSSVWRKFKKASESATDINKHIEIWLKLADKGSKALEYFESVI